MLESSNVLNVGVMLFRGVEARKGGPQVMSSNGRAGRLDRLRSWLDPNWSVCSLAVCFLTCLWFQFNSLLWSAVSYCRFLHKEQISLHAASTAKDRVKIWIIICVIISVFSRQLDILFLAVILTRLNTAAYAREEDIIPTPVVVFAFIEAIQGKNCDQY